MSVYLMAAPVKLSFGAKVALPKKQTAKVVKPANAFSAIADEEDDDKASSSDKKPSTSQRPQAPFAQNAVTSRSQKLKQAEAQALDASVYEYDEVYDNMKEGERKALEARKQEDAGRKASYLRSWIERES
jgi:coiled-coil domain-containing protein 55